MRKIKWTTLIALILLAVIALLGIGERPVYAALDTQEFTVNNTTPKTLTVTLLGPQNYVIPSPPGKTRIVVLEGRYQYSYYDCGGIQLDRINILKKGVELKILPCNAPGGAGVATTGGSTGGTPDTVDFTINNRTYRNLNVSLVGELVYRFAGPPGKSTYQIVKGKYQLSYYDCGGLIFDSITVVKDSFLYKIQDCNQSSGAAAIGGASLPPGTISTAPFGTGTLLINNKSGREVNFYLGGVLYSTLQAPPGKTRFEVASGQFAFSYYACGRLNQGVINIQKKRESEVILTECTSQFSGQALTGELVIFKVKNNADKKFDLTMEGPQEYTFFIKAARGGVFEVQKGIYVYSYTVCGETFQGIVNLNRDGIILKAFGCLTGN